MWFKNLVLYRLGQPMPLAPERLSAALAEHAFRPCGGLEPSSSGWSPPLGRLGESLVHAAAGSVLLCLRREVRLLPPAVVRETLDERVAAIETREQRAVGARERRRMRDEVVFELMPRAFTRSTHTLAYLAPASGWLAVDAASARAAEELVVLLAHSLDGLAVEPFAGDRSGAAVLTRWLESRRLPRGLRLGDECELRDPADQGAVVRCLRQDLESREIRAHLDAHKKVERLGLEFEDSVSFVLCADLTLRRLRFANADDVERLDASDAVGRLDAAFAYMSVEINRLAARLDELF